MQQVRVLFRLLFVVHLFLAPAHAGRFDTRTVGAFVEDCIGKLGRVTRRQHHRINSFIWGAEVADHMRTRQLASLPRRKLERSALALDYLETHPVFVSVTTSPQRIVHLSRVIKSLDLTYVTEVMVVIPQRFARTNETYQIPDELRSLPKVRIEVIPDDLGPATKFLPAAEKLAQRKDEPLLITIDDDMIYPVGMVNELIGAAAEFPNAAVGGVGAPLSLWSLYTIATEAGPTYFWGGDIAFRSVDVLEGYAAVGYPVKKIPLQTLREWVRLSDDCRYSDDLLISMALRRVGVRRYEISSYFYDRSYIFHLPHGQGPDALHRGAGLVGPVGGGLIQPSNSEKYLRAFETLVEKGGLQ